MTITALAALHNAGCAKHVTIAHAAPIGHTQTGIASWYGEPYHGRKTASGEVYDMNRWTAAHRTLPFGTWIEVTNLSNAQRVSVRVNDRGPFVRGRIIDLSRAAATQIGMIGPGTARVRLKVIKAPRVVDSNAVGTWFAVEVASFTDRAAAERLQHKFEGKRQSTRLVQRDAADQTRWRVLVGRESNINDAELLATSLRVEYPDALVVRIDP
ncbi:MAG TPA: septal ring lytic transglycosylase RlpA family protein [Bryobacteraceae bacterium]|jgi:rare lipoprotein A